MSPDIIDFLIQSAQYQNNILENMAKTQAELDSKLDELQAALKAGLSVLSDHLAILQEQVNSAVASATAKADLQPEFDKAQEMINQLKTATIPSQPSELPPPAETEESK